MGLLLSNRVARVPAICAAVSLAASIGCGGSGPAAARAANAAASGAAARVEVPADGVRLSGTVEAVRARSVLVPRLAGQTANSLVVTRLVRAGTRVADGDVLVEFDPQEQLRNAMDRRADVVDLDGQIQKKRADQAIARAADETALALALHDLDRATLDLAKKEFVAPIEAEKNALAVEQNTAKVAQLRQTLALRQKSADAELAVLQIKKSRSERALHYAENNITLMSVRAGFAGVAVIKSIFKGNGMSEVVEGDDVRPGQAILDVIDPTAMQVRARINQADIGLVTTGQPATIRLDAYPELTFHGLVQVVTPLGVASSMTPTVHTFTAVVSIDGTHPRLMPDLTASVDLARGEARPAQTASVQEGP